MGIAEFFRSQFQRRRSKHIGTGPMGRVAQIANPAGTKLAKYFVKAKMRGPRGY